MTQERDKGWPCVDALVVDMKKKLDLNDYKGGWRRMTLPALLKLLLDEVDELTSDVMTTEQLRRIEAEAVDVANIAMMIHDVAGRRARKSTTR